MKTTLGVGISVLSALAAQGKDFDRSELNAMLDRLAASPEPKIEPDAGAMCYEMAEPRLESYEHQCRKCGEKTVYPPDQKEWRRYLRTLRNGALSLKAKGLNIELDDFCLCWKCGKEVFIAGESGLSITNRGKVVSVPQGEDEGRKFGWRVGDELQIVEGEDAMAAMRPLTDAQYAKVNFRRRQAALSYPEKVRQLVELQKRLVPIYAARGKVIVPWTDV